MALLSRTADNMVRDIAQIMFFMKNDIKIRATTVILFLLVV
ncbi:hypothetical protein [Fischerella sp. JS2]|nr:hypothetical protein [Fischerella sp. JS2]